MKDWMTNGIRGIEPWRGRHKPTKMRSDWRIKICLACPRAECKKGTCGLIRRKARPIGEA